MSAPHNLQRDCHFIRCDRTQDVDWGTPQAFYNTQITANTSGSVNTDYGIVRANPLTELTLSQAQIASVGVLISPPIGDRHPYRVKASLIIPADGDAFGLVGFGWGPASPGGNDDSSSEVVYRAFYVNADETFIVEPPPVIYEGNPLHVTLSIVATKSLNAVRVDGHLSVQNLGVKPPTMHNAVS